MKYLGGAMNKMSHHLHYLIKYYIKISDPNCLPDFGGGYAQFTLENPTEIIDGLKSKIVTDLFDTFVGIEQHLFGP